jgi:nitrite reductase/ring-hydroxylating ferredoxin subunit
MQKIAMLNEFASDGTLVLKVDDRQLVMTLRNGQVRAFVNSCPHMGVPLNASGDKITTFDDTLLICTMHGAMFEFDSGNCIGGPCAGRSLQSVDIIVENEAIFIK